MQPSSPAEVEERVMRARIRLALRQPFLASALMRLPMVSVPWQAWCPTMATDGYTIYYNVAWVERLDDAALRGVLAHELLHVVFCHAQRRDARDAQGWNQACDLAINLLLLEQGFRLPAGGLMDLDYAGLSAEQIYARLHDDEDDAAVALQPARRRGALDDGSLDDDSGDASGVLVEAGLDLKDPNDPWALALRSPDHPDEEQLRDVVTQLRNDALSRLQGRAAAWFRTECDAADGALVDWQALLRTWLHDRLRSDWSLWPPSRKHLHRGLVLPSVGTPSPGRLVFAVDTSGSMSDAEIAQIYGEIRAFRETFPCRLAVLQADACVHSVVEYDEMDGSEVPQRVQVVGRGGTDFRPVFEWLEEHGQGSDAAHSPLVFATDGYGTFPSAPPDCPVIWLRTGTGLKEELFPFGVVVSLGEAQRQGMRP
jgi:predicted metal-dependent peptidase